MGATSPPLPEVIHSFWTEQALIRIHCLKDYWRKIYLEYIDWFLGELCRRSRCLYQMPCYNKLQQPGRPLCWKGAFIFVFSTSVFIDRPTAAELLRHKFFTKAKVRKHFLNWCVQRLWRGLVRSMIGVVTALLAWVGAVSLRASIAEWVEWVIVNKQNETPLLYLLVHAAVKEKLSRNSWAFKCRSVAFGVFSSLVMVPFWLRVQP